MYTLLRYAFYRLSSISKVVRYRPAFSHKQHAAALSARISPTFSSRSPPPRQADISRVTLPISTTIISDGIIVITFNITIVDDTIITVITTGEPVRPPIIVFYLPCLKSSFQGRNKLSTRRRTWCPVPVPGHRYNATVTS